MAKSKIVNKLISIGDIVKNAEGRISIVIKSKESGIEIRKSGEKIRTELINIHRQSGKSITLDFKDLNIVSSSFADELIGKLVAEYGFYAFNNVFKLKNMNTSVQSIVQRSVAQRMIESFDNNREK